MPPTKAPDEFKALQVVHGAIQPLLPEARGRVVTAVSAMLAIKYDSSSPVPAAAQPLSSPGGQPAAPAPAIGQLDIAAFIKAKRPLDNYQRLACLAYFIERKDGQREISGKDLVKANSDARQPRFSNLSVFLNHATHRHKFFSQCGRGKKQLTTLGEAVVDALPSQADVTQVLSEDRTPKPSKRRTPTITK
jgi:hypothetical protein